MEKLNFRFFIKLFFIASLIITTHLNAYSVSIGCKDVKIDGPENVCSARNSYSLNYDNARCVSWEVTGGVIVSIGGKPIQDFYDKYKEKLTDSTAGATSIVGLTFCNGGWGILKVNSSKLGTYYEDWGPGLASWLLSFSNNPAMNIEVEWDINAYKQIQVEGKGLSTLGRCGQGSATKVVNFISGIPNFTLTSTLINPLCSQGVTISGAPGNGTSYNWNTSGGIIPNGGNWNTGINISNFTRDGVVPISVTVSNQCNSVTRTITLNVTQPDFGHVQQNNANVDEPGTLVTLDCQGNFNLNMPTWVSNNAIYTWELPGTSYDSQTNTYAKTIVTGRNKQNVQGQLPTGGLTDFVGKVTITGVCGAPVVRTFIVRPTLRPTVDADIYSCSNTVVINVNNPTANGSNINAWVAPTYPSVWGTFVNATPTSVQFTASNPGAYVINIGVNGTGGCYTQLQTTVHAVSASGNTNAGTAGWQSGVLSDNRKAPGSNLATYGSNIYFTGRDGKIYFYSYSAALQKWVINQIPGITNAAIPAAGAFTKIGVATLGGVSYLYYTDNATGSFLKIDLATNIVSPGMSPNINASDFITMGNDVYAIQKGTNALYYNNFQITNIGNATLKTIIPGNGVIYLQNNNLYSTTLGQLTFSNEVYASSDVVVLGGYLYYARGQKGVANLFRLPLNTLSPIEQITTTTNLSGVFTINLATGVIYYGVLNSGALNTTTTVASGVYKSANIYQASLSGTTWTFNAATTVKPWEGLDMYIQSPIYSGNHVYYIGAGHNDVIKTAYELEVWNLYYENACAPVLQRVGADDADVETATEILLYPNPFNTELMIDLSTYTEDGNPTSLAIEVVDATGKTIYKSTALSELNTISTTDWAQGMYVVKIKHNNTLINKKVVKY